MASCHIGSIVHRRFANRPLLRRFVALGVAYAIALASVIATVGAVRAEVADATSSGIVLCHVTRSGQSAPPGIPPKGCDNSCCIGCLALLVAVPPPPMTSIAVRQNQGRPLPPPVATDLPSDPQIKSHRSRAPPFAV
jgi:hypothetical protein